MSFWLYLPQNVPEEAVAQGLPLIVMLHGCHQTATQFAQGTRMNQWAERKGYAVLYPQQLVSNQSQRCWKWYDRATQEGGGDPALKFNAKAGPDATRMMLEFFARHRRG